MDNVGAIMQNDPLVNLVQKDNFVGWVYAIDYTTAMLMTNDLWKARVAGVPHNSFLLATAFDPGRFQDAHPAEREVVLLRVVGTAKLPQDDDLVRAKVDHFQQERRSDGRPDYDDITRNQLQFGGLECRVLGTFFTRDGHLHLGSDLETFAAAARLTVFRPRGEALSTIVNHVDPLRRAAAVEEARQLGLARPVEPFPIGTVRYTSTDRLHRATDADKVRVLVQPSDFLARRTAVLGMTRTGKSNMVKQMVSVVMRVADAGGVTIGQIIYDVNGEYANANQQDKGSIADLYGDQCVRYRMLRTDGFQMLQNNFYLQLAEGFAVIRRVLTEQKADTSGDVQVFLNTSFDEPDRQDHSAHNRWKVRVAAYQAMLYQAGFEPPKDFRIRFPANPDVLAAVGRVPKPEAPQGDPTKGLAPGDAVAWFLAAREANKPKKQSPKSTSGNDGHEDKADQVEGGPLKSTSGKDWLDDDTVAILNMLANKNPNDAYIRGYKVLGEARDYHSPLRKQEVGDEIYGHLADGKIVILDLSVGEATLRERISGQIARDIFDKSMHRFVRGETPPNVVVYVEEAHNLIGKDADLTDTWPRLAKEGAKYRIGLVYATQEVSSVHPNIRANTENWFVTHLNNEREVKELGQFYDFADFGPSLMRAQDVGFARVKTLSSPYVVPVQIDKFELPEKPAEPAAAEQPAARPAPPPKPASRRAAVSPADDIPF